MVFFFFYFTLNKLQLSKQKSVFVFVHSQLHSWFWRNGTALLSPLLLPSAFFLFLMSLGVSFFFPHSQWLLEKGFFFYLRIYFSSTFKYCSAVAFLLPHMQAKWICQELLAALGERRITYSSQATAVSLRNWSCSAVSD